MSDIPESFEVLLYYLQILVESAGAAQEDPEAAQKYTDVVEELASNHVRMFGVLAIIASVLHKISTSTGFELAVGSSDPEDYEVMLVAWVAAVKKMDAEKISDLSTALAECDTETIEGFIFLLMSFYLTLVDDS